MHRFQQAAVSSISVAAAAMVGYSVGKRDVERDQEWSSVFSCFSDKIFLIKYRKLFFKSCRGYKFYPHVYIFSENIDNHVAKMSPRASELKKKVQRWQNRDCILQGHDN